MERLYPEALWHPLEEARPMTVQCGEESEVPHIRSLEVASKEMMKRALREIDFPGEQTAAIVHALEAVRCEIQALRAQLIEQGDLK